jgi:hypothetical protein
VLKVREGNLLVAFAAIRDETATETEKTISIGLSNTFDQAMKQQHSEDPGDLSADLELSCFRMEFFFKIHL